MRRHTPIITVTMTVLLAACGTRPGSDMAMQPDSSIVKTFPGDSMVYGLACEGCSDTIVTILTNTDSDPDTFDVLEAATNRQIFGMPKTGDVIAILPQDSDATAASIVVNLSRLKGSWCYMAVPELRIRAGITEEMHRKFINEMPDSTRQRLLKPREYGFELRSDFTARPIGMQRTTQADANSPAVYPPLKRYHQWHIVNGRIVLNETRPDTLGKHHVLSSDTAEFVALRRDSLILRFTDGSEKRYYRQNRK